MSSLQSLEGFQRARKKQKSLEEKAKIFEENARIAKLSIDKQLYTQILQEMDHTHDDVIRELEDKVQEENRNHNDATKELREKIADLERQIKSPLRADGTSNETTHVLAHEVHEPVQETPEPVQEMPKPSEEVSTDVDEDDSARIGALQERVRNVLQNYKQSESEVPQETSKKKKRNFFQ